MIGKTLYFFVALLFSAAASAECYHYDSALYLHGFRQPIGVDLLHTNENKNGGITVGYEKKVKINGFPSIIIATYEDVGTNLFSFSNYLLRMCDQYYFGGVWANIEDYSFLKENEFSLQRDKSPYGFSLFVIYGSWVAKLFFVDMEKIEGVGYAYIESQLMPANSPGATKTTERDKDSPLAHVRVKEGGTFEVDKIGKIKIEKILEGSRERPAWVILSFPK